MGYLAYDSQQLDLKIEDRTLAHLQIVIVNKLRRGESFVFSWRDPMEVGDGRSSVWMHPFVSLHFKFSGSRVPSINKTWLRALYAAADSGRGLHISDEPLEDSTTDFGEEDGYPLG